MSPEASVDVLVVGAGVAGLCSALALAESGRSVAVLEPRPRPGMEASTHNSGVIHAGIYYPPGSLKAELCVDGRDRLYTFCRAHDVPVRQTGKLIVASGPSDLPRLEAIGANAAANGARVELVDGAFVRAREPLIAAAAALWSPDTGLVDAAAYVHALARRITAAGGVLLMHSPLTGADLVPGGLRLSTPHEHITAQLVVNAAGVFADDVSHVLGGERFRIWACRGDYAEVVRSAGPLVSMPVYPLPETSGHGLGVHLTPGLSGTTLLGPTSAYQDSKTDYESNRVPLAHFAEAARQLAPALNHEWLRAGGSGIRAKRHPPHETFADFLIAPDAINGRIIQVAGIDSPGLTASLAIGARVARLAASAL